MAERYRLGVVEPTVIAVDWSGARTSRKGIWLARRARPVVSPRAARSRRARTRSPTSRISRGPLIAGFDFSFGVPGVVRPRPRLHDVDEVWTLAARDGESWLAPTPPFLAEARVTSRPSTAFRRCEMRYPAAKSLFQLVGNGQVGAGSVRGMPLLPRLRAAGVADLAVRPARTAHRRSRSIPPRCASASSPDAGPFANEHERDAVCSALVMWRQRETVAALRAATDPTIRLEGDIWAPTPPQR